MAGSEQNAGRRDRDHGQVGNLLSRNREPLAIGIFAGLAVAALIAAIERVAGAGTLVSIAAVAAALAFAAGSLVTWRVLRRPATPAEVGEGRPADLPGSPDAGSTAGHPAPAGAKDIAKLTSYREYFLSAFNRLQLGPLDNVEAELLSRPARLLERWNRGNVQLAVFDPAEGDDGKAFWHLPYVAGISRSECGEFEVPLEESALAERQARWDPQEGVMVACDLQEERWRTKADFEAFAHAGFRMLRFFPFGPPGAAGQTRPCIVLLSKEGQGSATFGGPDDDYLMLLGTLLKIQALHIERARFLSEGGGEAR